MIKNLRAVGSHTRSRYRKIGCNLMYHSEKMVGSRAAAHERRNGSTRGCRERSDAKVCVSASVAEGPSATFVDFLRGCPRDLGTNGDGAPPQAHIHLNLEVDTSGSPRTKFERYVTVCNRHLGYFSLCCYALWGTPSEINYYLRINKRRSAHLCCY